MLFEIYKIIAITNFVIWITVFVILKTIDFIAWLNDSYEPKHDDDQIGTIILLFMTTIAWPATIIISVLGLIAHGLRYIVRKFKRKNEI